jgi:hypothetical protein
MSLILFSTLFPIQPEQNLSLRTQKQHCVGGCAAAAADAVPFMLASLERERLRK